MISLHTYDNVWMKISQLRVTEGDAVTRGYVFGVGFYQPDPATDRAWETRFPVKTLLTHVCWRSPKKCERGRSIAIWRLNGKEVK